MSAEPLSATAPIEHKLPEGWREVPLASVAEVRFSGVNKLSLPSEKPVRLCNYTDVYNNDYITGGLEFMRATATQPEVNRFGLQLGDVIITKDSETPDDIGIAAVVDYTAPDLLCGYHLALFRPRTGEVDPTFLAKQLRHHRLARYFGQRANGLTRYGLPTAVVANAPLWLPELAKQRDIGALLRLVDEAVAKTEAVIAKLKQVRAGLLHDLLIRGLDEHGQLRDPIAHPEQFQDPPLGRIPRDWEIATLVSRISLPQGQVDPRALPYSEWLLVAPDHIESETGRLIARQTAAEQGAISGKYVFEPGDVVYSKIRPYLRKAILASDQGLCSADMYPLRPNPGVNSRFLLAAILGESFSRFASAVSMRSGFPKLNRDELAEFVMGWPKPDEQNRIAAVLTALDQEQTAVEREVAKLHQLKSGLMADLLTGRVRVPEGVEVAA